jgi:hypothetical protein
MFAIINDPEGPNLLVVTAAAAVLYLICATFYLSSLSPSLRGLKRGSVTVLLQIFVAIGLGLALR